MGPIETENAERLKSARMRLGAVGVKVGVARPVAASPAVGPYRAPYSRPSPPDDGLIRPVENEAMDKFTWHVVDVIEKNCRSYAQLEKLTAVTRQTFTEWREGRYSATGRKGSQVLRVFGYVIKVEKKA